MIQKTLNSLKLNIRKALEIWMQKHVSRLNIFQEQNNSLDIFPTLFIAFFSNLPIAPKLLKLAVYNELALKKFGYEK